MNKIRDLTGIAYTGTSSEDRDDNPVGPEGSHELGVRAGSALLEVIGASIEEQAQDTEAGETGEKNRMPAGRVQAISDHK